MLYKKSVKRTNSMDSIVEEENIQCFVHDPGT